MQLIQTTVKPSTGEFMETDERTEETAGVPDE
jgi:hypothetical protein